MAIFAWLRDDIKLPFKRTSSRIVTENIAWDIFYTRLVVALLCGVTDNNCIVDDNRRR